MKPPIRIQSLVSVLALGITILSPTRSDADTTTLTANGNWTGGSWDNGQPGTGDDAVIGAGVIATANGAISAWDGTLVLEAGSQLSVSGSTTDFIAPAGATSIYFKNEAEILDHFKSRTLSAGIILDGGGGFRALSNAAHNQSRTFAGEISGNGGFSLNGTNMVSYYFARPNSFTGGLVLDAKDRYNVHFGSPGSAGQGDVTVLPAANGRSAAIRLGTNDVFAPTATLTLNGSGWNNTNAGSAFASSFGGTSVRIAMQTFNARVSRLIVGGIEQPPGQYTGTSGNWISGTGILTVQPVTPDNPVIARRDSNGDVRWSWNNLPPTSGPDVSVDIWFGTDPNTLSQVAAGQLNLTEYVVNAATEGIYYGRIDSHLDGNPNGTPATGTVFSFVVEDAPPGLTLEAWYGLSELNSILALQREGIAMRPADWESVATTPSSENLSAGSGVRMRGLITPATTGDYTFHIAGKGNVSLWLSTDGSRFNKQRIAWHYEITNPGQWNKFPSQQSAAIHLDAGTSYYLESQVMSAAVGGHMGIAWSGPGIPTPQIIPAASLTALEADPLDENDNNLPDFWEQQTGLDLSALPGALSEYGDPDNDGITNFDEYLSAALGSNPLQKDALADGITRETWTELGGYPLSGIISKRNRFLNHPNEHAHVPGIDDSDRGVSYGARYRGFVVAPVTGDYRFWIAGNDYCELWLAAGSVRHPNTNLPLTTRFGKQRVAHNQNGPTNGYLRFDDRLAQRSRIIHLVEGQSYFIEVLHKQASGGDHVTVAWQPPGQPRSILPAAVLLGDIPNDDDRDNDCLPDSWESSVGLNPADDGLIDPSQGEYADPDGDGLTNLVEFQHGTNPFSSDTDGDGFSDHDEIFYYHTDPTVSNFLNPVLIATPDLRQYTTATTGSWSNSANGSVSAADRRGGITYTFSVTEPGVHELAITGGAISSTPWSTKLLNLVLSLDEDPPFATGTISSKNGAPGTLRALTPWLAIGPHTLTIFHDNVLADLHLRLDSVTISRLGGADLDEDGIPDWIAANEAAANKMTRVPTQSRTSPLSIEGISRQLSSTTLTALMPGALEPDEIPATASINDTFFADVPLSPDGAVTLATSFLGGVITEKHDISWIATNLFEFDQSDLHIRQGDSLRIDAWSAAAADGQPFTVTLEGLLLEDETQNTTHTSGQPLSVSFETAGTYTLVASHDSQTTTVTLQVHSADFGPAHLVHIGQPRPWTPPVLGATTLVEADENLTAIETSVSGSRTFQIDTDEAANHHILARLPGGIEGAPAAILARGTVHGFDTAQADRTRDSQILHRYDDGTWLTRSTVVAVNLPEGAIVRITIAAQGTLFTNGSNILELRAEDFDINGIAHIYYENSGATAPKLCHRAIILIEP